MVNVNELFSAAGVSRTGVVRWGETVPQQAPGVYLITTTSSAEDATGLSKAPINLGEVARRRAHALAIFSANVSHAACSSSTLPVASQYRVTFMPTSLSST